MKFKFSLHSFIKVVLIFALFLFCTISYHPYFYSVAEEVSQGEIVTSPFIRYITFTLFALVILSCINYKGNIIDNRFNKYLIIISVVFLFTLIIYAMFDNRMGFRDLKTLLTCMGAFFIGWRFTINERLFKTLSFCYGIMVGIVAFFQIIENNGGFVILESYQTDGKNALGATLAVSIVMFFGIARSNSSRKFERVFALMLCLFLFVEILTIRARLAMISAVAVIFLLYYYTRKERIIYYIIIPIVLTILLILLPESSVYDYIYNSLFLNKEGDVTAGRVDMNMRALQIISEDPLVANLYSNHQSLDIRVHNWALKRMYEYGVFFSIPFITIYIMMFISLCKRLFKPLNDTVLYLGYAMVFTLFIISLGEPSMPFSPGTAMTPVYFFWGYSYQLLSCNTINNCMNRYVRL